MPTPEQSKRAGNIDVADFGDKDVSGAYRKGQALVNVGEGEPIDLALMSDIIGAAPPGMPDAPYN